MSEHFQMRNYSIPFNVSFLNNTHNSSLSEDYVFEPNLSVIVTYLFLFTIAAIGNLTVFISLFRSRHRRSRISLMIRHLAIADLIVTFVMIPIEVGWRITGEWIAGNVACKVFLFLRAFGPYLSSNVLVCVSLDRYFAVLYPLRVSDATRRGKSMLTVAWVASFIYCIPQSFVFSVMAHPQYPHYMQCVSFGFFTSPSYEVLYNLLCLVFMYFIPLFVIIVAYTAIICEISKNSQPPQDLPQIEADDGVRKEPEEEDEPLHPTGEKNDGSQDFNEMEIKIGKKKSCVKRTWEQKESDAVLREFKNMIKRGEIECEKFIEKYPFLEHQKWTDIKFHVKDHISKINKIKNSH